MLKLLIKHPEIRPYRVPFFNAIGKNHLIRFMLNRSPEGYICKHAVIGTIKKSMWLDWRTVKVFLSEVASGDYDILVSSTPLASATIFAVTIAKMRRKKVILWSEEWRTSFTGWKGKSGRFLLRYMYRQSDAHFATSMKTTKHLLHNFSIPKEKIFFAPQCNIDLGKVHLNSMTYRIPKSSFTFLFMARVIDLKGLDYLLRAFALVQEDYPNSFLFIVGDGDELDKSKQLARDLNISACSFLGSIPDADDAMKCTIISACDVFILPSRIIKNQYEGWGLVVGEAMSMGKPVIATDAVGCTDDLIEDGVNGYVVSHSSVEDLASAMRTMLRDREKIPAMGNASREIFERQISYERMSETFLNAVAYVSSS